MASPTSESDKVAVIFGGLGFIGRYTCRAFAEVGYRVTVVDYTEPEADYPFPTVVAALDQPDLYVDQLRTADVVVCLASSNLPATANTNLAIDIEKNVQSTVALAELCAEHGVESFLFASSGGTVYGDGASVDIREDTPSMPINGYGASKVAIENYLRVLARMTSLRVRSLRISNPFGLGQDPRRKQGFIAAAVNAALTGEELSIWGDGSVVRDYIHVADVAQAFVAASDYDGGFTEFNVGSGSGLTLLEVLDETEQAFDTEIRVSFEPGREFDVPANVLNIERSGSQLGWVPEVKMRDALKEMAKDPSTIPNTYR